MSLKVSAVDQLCKYELLKGGNGAGIETELALKIIHKALGQDHISYTQCGRNCLRKGVHIDHVIIIGKRIQSFLWLWGNRKLWLKIVLDNDAPFFAWSLQLLKPTLSREKCVCLQNLNKILCVLYNKSQSDIYRPSVQKEFKRFFIFGFWPTWKIIQDMI